MDSQNVSKTPAGKSRISQTDFPAYTVDQALRVARVIRDEYAKQPTNPLDVAKALKMTPSSGTFRTLTSAAVAYGLTTSGGQSKNPIALTEVGRRIVAPQTEGDDKVAMAEALLKPRINREFLNKYNGCPMPSDDIAKNVLESMGVPLKLLEKTLKQIVEECARLGILDNIGGKKYVRLDSVGSIANIPDINDEEVTLPKANKTNGDQRDETNEQQPQQGINPIPITQKIEDNRRVFITHGSNLDIVSQIKEVLTFGNFEPILSVEKESTAKPVPDKVLDDMRSCGAAIVHVGAEETMLDAQGKEHKILNQNVLIEIGAAMALFGRRFILLVEEGTKLPSNLQGLYEVRYSGETLDYAATMKLLKAFNKFRELSTA
jgi:predicted nucleotide-binding protein